MEKIGVNGATVLTEKGVGDLRVTLFTMLVRGNTSFTEAVKEIYADPTMREDMWVMAFQTRDIRGGKGERTLFYNLFMALHALDPTTAEHMITLLPEYGYWKDLIELLPAQGSSSLSAAILDLIYAQYQQDLKHYRNDTISKLSLLAKWLPREAVDPRRAHMIAKALYPDTPSKRTRIIIYRKMCAAMNKDLKTVEINMCANTWKDIDPARVPGRAMKCHKDAFFKGGSQDRDACRQHFLDHIEDIKAGKATMKGTNTVFPHEIVKELHERYHEPDKQRLSVLQAQWDAIREATEKAGGLGRAIPMCDFSGSMEGTPMDVSIAIGILISEITHPAFRDQMITFDSNPSWLTFPSEPFTPYDQRLLKKVKATRNVSKGLSTNFYAACRLILETLLQKEVPMGEEPEDLIVVTDMGFDAAAGSATPPEVYNAMGITDEMHQELQLARIRREFAEAGYRPPRIVVWNVRAAFNDFHASAHQEGVVQLSGWSPSILSALQKGTVRTQTPYEGLRATLDDPRYDAVRAHLKTAQRTSEHARATSPVDGSCSPVSE
jgi:hypothetical protein